MRTRQERDSLDREFATRTGLTPYMLEGLKQTRGYYGEHKTLEEVQWIEVDQPDEDGEEDC
jgi:hypothetical protein